MTTTNFDLRRRLETEHKRLIAELKQLKARLRQAGERRERSHLSNDEVARELIEVNTCLAQQNRIIDCLTEVEQALRKFGNGTYGLCDICAQPIDLARLEALPAANLCLNCKAQEEKKAKNPPARQGHSGRKNTAYKESKAYSYYSVAALLEYYERVWKDEQKAS